MVNNTYIVHSGVKGQKWGVRRFQNEDGSLTAEGRSHYGVGEGTNKNGQKRSSNENKKGLSVKKALAIAGTAAAAAAAGYIAYKKATKLRDVMRSNAREEAIKWETNTIGLIFKHVHDTEEAKYNRSYKKYFDRHGDTKNSAEHNRRMVENMRKARDTARQLQEARANVKYYKNMAENATRRDAIRTYFNERVPRSSVRRANRLQQINAINQRLKNSRNNTRLSVTDQFKRKL